MYTLSIWDLRVGIITAFRTLPVSNVTVSRSTKFLGPLHFKSRSRAAKVLGSILAVMVRNGEHRSTHQKFWAHLGSRHGSILAAASSNTPNRAIDVRAWPVSFLGTNWWVGNETVLAIRKSISGTVLILGHTSHITWRLRGTNTFKKVCVKLNYLPNTSWTLSISILKKSQL